MKKLTAIFIIFLFVLSSIPALAVEGVTKAHPVSPFNIIGGWFSSLGKRADGTSIWGPRINESTLSVDKIKERRGKIGAGMRGKIED